MSISHNCYWKTLLVVKHITEEYNISRYLVNIKVIVENPELIVNYNLDSASPICGDILVTFKMPWILATYACKTVAIKTVVI